ncbi:MAG: ADP-ribose pyrophosphatase [Peptococcaceae bacterium BICA1-7]|nr:MAG: ADP-ribose pyrophosphatase [Peptococcaceae bacterium BICA1-7]HBV97869.1 ADP-ribose pyrophosphatase [Desulfotomaculum sp.]
MKQRFFFCPKCGGRLLYRAGGERPRLTCDRCGYILYENPAVGVAVVVLDPEGRILLGRRAGSYKGQWCIPCGYVEYDEDVYSAAVREFHEETGLYIRVTGVCAVKSNFHNPELHTVGIWFWAVVEGGELGAGSDLDRLGYFHPADLPPLAFPTDKEVIRELCPSLNCR